jgi:hypothetical protein
MRSNAVSDAATARAVPGSRQIPMLSAPTMVSSPATTAPSQSSATPTGLAGVSAACSAAPSPTATNAVKPTAWKKRAPGLLAGSAPLLMAAASANVTAHPQSAATRPKIASSRRMPCRPCIGYRLSWACRLPRTHPHTPPGASIPERAYRRYRVGARYLVRNITYSAAQEPASAGSRLARRAGRRLLLAGAMRLPSGLSYHVAPSLLSSGAVSSQQRAPATGMPFCSATTRRRNPHVVSSMGRRRRHERSLLVALRSVRGVV